MNEDNYLLWSGRLMGWYTRGGVYTSTRADAAVLPRSEALILAQRHYKNGMSEFGLIPVPLADLEEISL